MRSVILTPPVGASLDPWSSGPRGASAAGGRPRPSSRGELDLALD
jgi:hypothetical protein